MHTFPADGDYVFRMDLHGNACGVLFGGTDDGEQLEVSIDGERVALLEIDPRMTEATTGVTLKTPPIHITAGAKRVSAAFIQQFEGPVIDLIAPIDHTLADTQIGVALRHHDASAPEGLEHRRTVPDHRRVRDRQPPQGLHLPPDLAGEEAPCAREHRPAAGDAGVPRSVSESDFAALVAVLRGRPQASAGSRRASRSAIEAMLASPQFLFRLEPARAVGDRRHAIASAIASWRRGCRFSCGARRPTPSC